MLARNKQIIQTLAEEVIQRGALERIPEFFSPDYVPHDPSNPARRGGIDGARDFIGMLHAGLSDVRYAVEDLIAEGDRVVYRWVLQGTHTGFFMGVPPTGRALRVTGIDIFRLANGKIVESWVSADALGMLQQLGVLPAMGPPPGSSVGAPPPSSGLKAPPLSGSPLSGSPLSGSPVSGSPVSAVPPTMRS